MTIPPPPPSAPLYRQHSQLCSEKFKLDDNIMMNILVLMRLIGGAMAVAFVIQKLIEPS